MTKRKLVLANNPLLSGPALNDRERGAVPYRDIDLDSIDRDANQPRVNFDEEKLAELAESVKRYGVISPVIVRPTKMAGRYKLIAGERRVRAARMAGLSTIPAIVDREEDQSGQKTLSIQLVENIQRSDLTPLERAHAIGALKETYEMSVRDVADALGISKSMVQRSLDILDLPDDLLNALREGAAESKVLLLAKIEDQEIRASYLKEIDTFTRVKLQREVDQKLSGSGSLGNLTPEDERIVDEIQRALGLKTRMSKPSVDSMSGKISIEFYSSDDLQALFRKLVAE